MAYGEKNQHVVSCYCSCILAFTWSYLICVLSVIKYPIWGFCYQMNYYTRRFIHNMRRVIKHMFMSHVTMFYYYSADFLWFFVLYVLPIDSPCNHVCSYHIPCACKHYSALFLSSSFITRVRIIIHYRNKRTAYDVCDTDTIREVKEKKSKEEGVNVDDVDLTHGGRRLDDDQQWGQIDVFLYYVEYLYMYKRWDVFR